MVYAELSDRGVAVAIVATVILAVAFVVDALTPQTLSAAVGYCLAIAMAVFTTSRRLTTALFVAALLVNIPAAILDAARSGYHWDLIGLITRIQSMGTIVIVAILTLALQAHLAARNRELAERKVVNSPLTVRETEILRMIADGTGDTAIAERLQVPVETIKAHVSDILRKLSASDRAHAAVIALREGFL